MIKAVVFDLWGTLAASKGPSLVKTIQDLKIVNLSEYEIGHLTAKALMLRPIKDLKAGLKDLCKLLGVKPEKKLLEDFERAWRKAAGRAQPFPDTVPLLSRLKTQYKLGLVSNCSFHSYKTLMKNYDLEKFFDVLALSYRLGITKPHKRMFEYVAKSLRVNFPEILYVGDSPKDDVQPARKLKMQAILIDRENKYKRKDSIKSLSEIPGLLKKP